MSKSKIGAAASRIQVGPTDTAADPNWAKSLVIVGTGFGSIQLPRGAVVVTDHDLARHAAIRGAWPWQIRDAPFVAIQLGNLRNRSAMAAAFVVEILLSRAMSAQAVWVLISEERRLDPGHVLSDDRVRLLLGRYRRVRFVGKGDLSSTVGEPERVSNSNDEYEAYMERVLEDQLHGPRMDAVADDIDE